MAGWEKWASRFHVMKQQRTKRDEAVRAANQPFHNQPWSGEAADHRVIIPTWKGPVRIIQSNS